jgi:hypothetical protein
MQEITKSNSESKDPRNLNDTKDAHETISSEIAQIKNLGNRSNVPASQSYTLDEKLLKGRVLSYKLKYIF